MPIAAPRYGLPPKRLVAEKPMSTGRKVNGALAKMLIIVARSRNCGNMSMMDCPPSNIAAVRTLLMPMSRPPATMAGMIGTKMSENILMKRCTGLPLLSSASSGALSATAPICFWTSSQTRLTSPDPRMIWNWLLVMNVPLTTSISEMASSLRRSGFLS